MPATIISEISDASVNSSVWRLAISMISSRIDYYNSLLYSVKKYNVAKLEKIQVIRLDKTSHVTSYPQKQYWHPISYHILFKYNLITFRAISFSQPTYLSSLIKTSCLMEISFLFLQFVPRRSLLGKVLQRLLRLNGTDSHNRSDHRTQ